MRRASSWRRRAYAVVLVGAWLGLGGAAQAPAGPPSCEAYLAAVSTELQQRLQRERIALLPSDPAKPGVVQGLVLFSQPYTQVWELLNQTARQREYRPEVTQIETLERFPDGVVDEHRIRILFMRLTYHLRYRFEPAAWHIEWALDPRFENGVEQIAGTWDLMDMKGDRTLGKFGTTVRVGAALPRALQDAVTRKKVPETLENVRQWVDANGRWRP
jgi:hypothetical protein